MGKASEEQDVFYYILSKDQGYDSLIHYINSQNGKEIVKRIITISDINEETKTSENGKEQKNNEYEKYSFVIDGFKKMQKTKRPKSESKLKSHIKTYAGKRNFSDVDIDNIVENMYRQKIISRGNNNRISYTI